MDLIATTLNIYNLLPYESRDAKITLLHVVSFRFLEDLNLDIVKGMSTVDFVKEMKKQKYTHTFEDLTAKATVELMKKYKDEVAFSTTQHKNVYTKEFTGKQLLSLIK
jgi:hypothetical protein